MNRETEAQREESRQFRAGWDKEGDRMESDRNQITIRASSLHRRKTCPGSHWLEDALPEEPDSEASTEGTFLHACMSSGKDAERDEQQWCLDFCRQQVAELKRAYIEPQEGEEFPEFTEIELAMPGLTGHADLIAMRGPVALLVDYKFGRIEVDAASENMQLRAYAMLLQHRAKGRFSTIYAAIIQPRVEREKKVTLVAYTAADLNQARDEFTQILRGMAMACGKPEAYLSPDADACRYCRARATCPALVKEAEEIMIRATSAIVPGNCAETFRKVKLVEGHLNALKSVVFLTVQNAESQNIPTPGIKLKPGAERRVVTDPNKAFVVTGLPPEKFAACCTVKISSLDAAYKEATGMKAKDAKESLNTLLTQAGALEVKRSEPSLILEGEA